MLFNSLEYILFFAVVVGLYFFIPVRMRKGWLLVSSLLFYMNWAPVFILLIFYSTTIDYFVALRLEREPNPTRRRWWLTLSLVTNFGALFIFKYYDFFIGSWQAVVGVDRSPPLLHLVLPVGISFYTFEAISYTIDVYRRRYPAERRYLRLLLFILFFPKLIAGPIERAAHLIPQFDREVSFEYERVRNGFAQILWGLFKKVVVADRLSIYVDAVYNNPSHHVGSTLSLATLFFTFQIYCDFSAYSDIAIGTARVMGIDLLRNFRRPYFSTSFGDFWSRWHISLSTWFRDYLYIPLGGNRGGFWSTNRNVFIVFLVSGIWHGANWTFVLWGIFHGVMLLTQNIWGRYVGRLLPVHPVSRVLKTLGVFLLVCLSWVLFRANSVADAFHIYQQILTHPDPAHFFSGNLRHLGYGIAGLLTVVTVELFMEMGFYPRLWSPRLKPVRWAVYVSFVLLILLIGVFDGGQFIYFQF